MQTSETVELEQEDEAIKTRVREAIRSKNMKIKQFARESGMAYPSLRDYYSGLRKPGFDAIAAILRFTGVSGDWLLTGRGPMFPNTEPEPALINEGLIAEIARLLESKFQDTIREQDGNLADEVRELLSRERTRRVDTVHEHTLIAANVYNRIAHIQDEPMLKDQMDKEVKSLLGLYLNMTRHVGDVKV